ncbi:Na+/Ca+ antiporter, CaCA family [[Clostridium] ultunense Esp]|uniref:Na+/Ca+ antiporter, CaCA family n=1 Tax=[Clostridium] ultunense Esp TaxID=1288971 RepID=M1Z254_9FIRM|nr:calcium/sodium antiporter [Schnuerera ultunensis]CCQ96945.1 Na+/Ca+ antiporter, CaCA family [[Clostridium] ultunense Esp]SHD78055.1 Na+/Ca+ antiporter, CaCA family [[Clostridium] ultunense Esp]
MEIIWVLIIFIIGLILIVKGGDIFVESAIWIAERTGISSGIIGATIISVATTLPEFFVSTVASNEGFSEMAVGNAIGSYICNIAFIMGLCSLIKPIKIRSNFFGIKGIMMISYLSIFFILSKEGIITYREGYMLIGLAVFFIIINIFEHKKTNGGNKRIKKGPIRKKDMLTNLFKFLFGGFFIVYGAHILVDSGVKIANFLRIPKQVISLTLLAIGTSLPELVTSLMAILKEQENISLGNILGANILNVSVIIGASALVSQQGLIISRQTLFLDIPMAMFVALIFIVSGIYKEKIGRITGLILLSTYIAYLLILF